ncbi:cupin domain-containing protein (plasmid) [Novosphingobium resinovorum]|uniref:cupin domain-containing protein n=1 Tax=Novosphingobium TaxID=165696 RepID=UPI001B3C6660|nr:MULTISPECIES: cupin domain-containing protein [Novosphingobium]MBF7015322.1 cupin domain-containing protein [Novosphingobium sp. HR1a]WJM30001.1 cupin domain-containing protein [Novosphingobium resinovorum]
MIAVDQGDGGYPPIQRVVTGHDKHGNSVFRSDDLLTTEGIPSGDAAFRTIWTTATVPADNNDETDGGTRATGLTLEGGSVIRIVDMYPGKASPMHRTNSIDYGIVLEGEIELELEDGLKKKVGRGGVIVQRGTNHLWRNTTQSVCRIIFVLIEAAPYRYGDAVLAELKPEDVQAANGV